MVVLPAAKVRKHESRPTEVGSLVEDGRQQERGKGRERRGRGWLDGWVEGAAGQPEEVEKKMNNGLIIGWKL